MISLDIWNGCYNVADGLSKKICVLSETKDRRVTLINMTTRIKDDQTLKNIFYVILNAYSNSKHVIQIKNGVMVNVNAIVKNIVRAKKL